MRMEVEDGREKKEEDVVVTPGEVLGKASNVRPGRGAYIAPHSRTVYASLTGRLITIPSSPNSPDQRPTVEVTGHKAHGAIPKPGSIVIARVTKVMTRMASADIMCVGSKAVKEKFTGIIRQQDVRATEIDKVDMHLSFRPGDIVKALVLSLGDARAYYLSTAKNELGVVSAESMAGLAPLAVLLLIMKGRCWANRQTDMWRQVGVGRSDFIGRQKLDITFDGAQVLDIILV